jgi:hypothetical protein
MPITTLEAVPSNNLPKPALKARPIPAQAEGLGKRNAEGASALPKAVVQAKPERQNCLPSQRPDHRRKPPESPNSLIPDILQPKSLESRFCSLEIP